MDRIDLNKIGIGGFVDNTIYIKRNVSKSQGHHENSVEAVHRLAYWQVFSSWKGVSTVPLIDAKAQESST